jgi:hypothetical protein
VDGEDHALAAAERHDLGAGLHRGALLGEDELAAGEVLVGLGEQDRHLEREDVLAVEVLVQAVVVAGAVLQEQGRGRAWPASWQRARKASCRSGKRAGRPIASFQAFATGARWR